MSNQPKVSLIAARGRNGVIGSNGDLPWRLKADLEAFKTRTLGHPVLMGRKTWESLPVRPLPGRENIVLTQDWTYSAGDARVYSSFAAAVNAAKAIAARQGRGEVFVIGGGEIYARALPMADRIYLTEVDTAPEGDARFPDLDEGDWQEIERQAHGADADNDHAFVIRTLVRRD